MDKSTRHSKIAGDFGEILFLYWLSKSGYEIALVDHTGIDLVAFNKTAKRRLGISVKTRTRSAGTENEGLYIKPTDLEKVRVACEFFECEPYWGIVIDRRPHIDAILISQKDMIDINGIGKMHINIKLSNKYMDKYKKLKDSIIINIHYKDSLRLGT